MERRQTDRQIDKKRQRERERERERLFSKKDTKVIKQPIELNRIY